MTYSIVALDPATGELGVAVQTRWLGVGSVVPWVEPGVGAVATQSFVEVSYGFHGLRLMREGRAPDEALAALLAEDAGEAVRQVGMVDATGRSAAHTGSRCVRYASHLVAPGVSVQANMMERSTVPAAMLAGFGAAAGDLADRLLAALRAAEGEGGDVRGRQSAAIVVGQGDAAPGEAPTPPWARRIDLRVEDHHDPLGELARLVKLSRAYDAMDEAERAFLRGDAEGALVARRASAALAPEDDMILLWAAVGLAQDGREAEARALFAQAAAAEPRSGEHLRRFAEAGHLPDADAVLRVLGLG
jgi:uncharacterized Ntn-hydrolase superfamily protein